MKDVSNFNKTLKINNEVFHEVSGKINESSLWEELYVSSKNCCKELHAFQGPSPQGFTVL